MPIRSAGVIHKGNPGPCVNRNRGRHGAVSAPVHGYLLGLSTVRPRIRCKLIRGQPHLRPTIAPQQQGEEYQQHQDDIASHAAPPLIVCAVPNADQEGGSRALMLYSFPAPHKALSGSTRVPGIVGPRGRPWARSAEAVSQGARGEFGGAGRPQGDAIRNIKGQIIGNGFMSGGATPHPV